jgi:Uncharacterized conserved protein (DUF2249)
MSTEITLDAREMVPPQPFEQATEILRQLQQGQYMRMLHRRAPYPLFEFCLAMGLSYQILESNSVPYEIVFYFPTDEQTLQQAGVL